MSPAQADRRAAAKPGPVAADALGVERRANAAYAPCMVFYTRAGFERACAEEVRVRAHPVSGEIQADPVSGFVVFSPHRAEAAKGLASSLQFSDLVFARQMFFSSGWMGNLPPTDRVARLVDEAAMLHEAFSDVFVETADTNEARARLGLCRRLEVPLRDRLKDSGRLREGMRGPRLHVFFVSQDAAYMGLSWPSNASPWFMGIPRLRFPKGAPSRSSLKLVEAFAAFLSPDEQARRLRPGATAVDLGAAPGGWSFELARRGLAVIAVDNGRLDPKVLASGCVTHMRADGFRFRPRKPVDWMVCDMVDKPSRVALLVAEWMASGMCRACIFNLKLPMKKRFEAVDLCRELIAERLALAGTAFELTLKHLYHDREEVTGYLRPRSRR